jgi:hypothetical protein
MPETAARDLAGKLIAFLAPSRGYWMASRRPARPSGRVTEG